MAIASTIEVAYGADLTADPTTWVWTDITAYARGSVQVQRGRPDFASVTPASCTLRLGNDDGRFSPYMPAGQWHRNLPIRASLNAGTGKVLRFQGQIADMRLDFPAKDRCETVITAAGALRRLRKARTLRSTLYRAITARNPVAYWPMEDSAGATQAASALPNGAPMTTTGLTFAADSSIPGSGPQPTIGSNSTVYAPIGGTFSGHWQVWWNLNLPAAPGTDTFVMQITTPGGTIAQWKLQISASGTSFWIYGYDAAGGQVVAQLIGGGGLTGVWNNWYLTARQNAGNIDWGIWYVPLVTPQGAFYGGFSGSVAGTLSYPTSASVPPSTALNGAGFGHLTAVDAYDSLPFSHLAGNGYQYELATDRVTRLCAEEGVPVTVTGTSSQMMGPQRLAKLIDLIQDCADVDSAMVVDGLGPGITYVSSDARYNLSVSLALDTAKTHIKLPWSPVDDDQRLCNDATFSRSGGSSARYTDDVSIAAEGDYDSGGSSVDVATDDQLPNRSSWQVHLGTVEQMRAPAIPINLIGTPDLVASWLACDVGDRVTLANLPAQCPPGGMDLVLEQYTETWDAATWTAALVTSPYDPWRVIVLAADTGDTDPNLCHLDTDDSALNASITTTATSLAVKTNSGPLWTQLADDFPFFIDIDGEQVRVKGITGSSSPQTFTVDRSVNGVVMTHLANAPVSVWDPPTLGL